MEVVLSALLYLCVNDVDCESRVYQCYDNLNIKRLDIQVTEEVQSDVFRYCFDNYVSETRNEN